MNINMLTYRFKWQKDENLFKNDYKKSRRYKNWSQISMILPCFMYSTSEPCTSFIQFFKKLEVQFLKIRAKANEQT